MIYCFIFISRVSHGINHPKQFQDVKEGPFQSPHLHGISKLDFLEGTEAIA